MRYLLLLAFVGCVQAPLKPIYEAELIPYALNYKDECLKFRNKCEISHISLLFADEEYPVVGTCHISSRSRYITIDRSYWASASEEARTVLLFHELGHCHLDRGHNNDLTLLGNSLTYQVPVSIMNRYVLPTYMYSANSLHYLQELFTGASSSNEIRTFKLSGGSKDGEICSGH